jgi:hypothetical protein
VPVLFSKNQRVTTHFESGTAKGPLFYLLTQQKSALQKGMRWNAETIFAGT